MIRSFVVMSSWKARSHHKDFQRQWNPQSGQKVRGKSAKRAMRSLV